jgi:quercetin dioxygenase-like cupin family protein
MLSVKSLENLGDLHGAMYDFKKAGDVLFKHNHTEADVHITIVARGKIKVYSHDWELEAIAGQLLDFRPNEPHEFMALEDNTRIFNILKKTGTNQSNYPVQDGTEAMEITDVEIPEPDISVSKVLMNP